MVQKASGGHKEIVLVLSMEWVKIVKCSRRNDLGGSDNESFIFLRQILPCFYTQSVEIRANCMIFFYFLDSFPFRISCTTVLARHAVVLQYYSAILFWNKSFHIQHYLRITSLLGIHSFSVSPQLPCKVRTWWKVYLMHTTNVQQNCINFINTTSPMHYFIS